MFKLSTLYFKRSQVLDLFERTRYAFWNIKDYDDMVKSTRRTRNMHAYFMIIYTVTAMIKPHMKGGRSLSFRIYTPEWLPRMAVLLYEDFVIVAAISSLVAFDLLVRTFLVLAEAQFKMINQEFLLIYDRHELDRGLLYQRIRKCVQHHSFLIDFMNRFSSIFSTALLLFAGNITLSLCICMYVMLQESFNINHWVHLIAGLNMIFTCYSWPAQALMNQANEVRNSIYLSHWQNHLTSARDVLTALSGCQKPLEVKAGKLLRVDMEMFLMSCKTMVSYCMFFQTISREDNNQ